MEYGAHLPLIDFGAGSASLAQLREYARTASDLGYGWLCANDHLVFSRPWLDGPSALAAVLDQSGEMRLATTVALPVVRGPVATAKTLGAIDLLSGGRLTAGVGPGSSARDYEAAGVPFEERWRRLDDAVRALRRLWGVESAPAPRGFYDVEGVTVEPVPAQRGGPPIWIGSWGSEAGLRRVARLGDGWLASAYNTTPEDFGRARAYLDECLRSAGRDAETFPNGLATAWMYVTEDTAECERVLAEVLAPALNRPVEAFRERVLVGSAEHCASLISTFASAGLQRIFVWPLADERRQLEVFRERVVPLVEAKG
jgi:alkanesulfonate monooxygenase SsuD/methylene tetrahydromethanopterin reductase-like flavin-dependent oxidoreductase (luciferase family)